MALLVFAFLFTVVGISSSHAMSVQAGNIADDSRPFITVWQTDNEGTSEDNQITIPGVGTNYLIAWEEVGNPGNNGSETGTDDHTVTFPSPGTYRVSISGDFTRIIFGGATGGDRQKILDIAQWGDIVWESMVQAFTNAANLEMSAVDAPDLSQATFAGSMFRGARSFNGDLSGWDVSNLTSMGSMFERATSFNGDISTWDVSNVTWMAGMFAFASSFNGDLSDWDVSSVFTMREMFLGAHSFNGDLEGWNTGNVETTSRMFMNASSFNGSLAGWDLSSLLETSSMFSGAVSFNGDLSSWDVSNIGYMIGMFQGATAFNADLSGWDVGNVIAFSHMFRDATSFNGNISGWDVSNANEMVGMFHNATSFNRDLSSWDVSGVQYMNYMFMGAKSFNQSLGDWNVRNVSEMHGRGTGGILDSTGLSIRNYDRTLIGWSEQQLRSGIELGAHGLLYCAEDARQALIDNFNWTILGDSLSTVCVTSTEPGTQLPGAFELQQNYPNPFNPDTQIRFALPEHAHVTLAVYNLVGQRVATILDEARSPGWHDVTFDAAGLASGLYIYRFEAGSHAESRQMLLIK